MESVDAKPSRYVARTTATAMSCSCARLTATVSIPASAASVAASPVNRRSHAPLSHDLDRAPQSGRSLWPEDLDRRLFCCEARCQPRRDRPRISDARRSFVRAEQAIGVAVAEGLDRALNLGDTHEVDADAHSGVVKRHNTSPDLLCKAYRGTTTTPCPGSSVASRPMRRRPTNEKYL